MVGTQKYFQCENCGEIREYEGADKGTLDCKKSKDRRHMVGDVFGSAEALNRIAKNAQYKRC